MARTAILAPIDRSFVSEVAVLTKNGKKLHDAYTHLTEQMLSFAQDFKRLWDRAQKLDGSDSGEHRNHLHDAMANVLETSNKSIRSRWIMIGSHAKQLIHHKDNLPPYRDTLYELALALKDEKPVIQWVKQKRITSDSSVRDVKLLRDSKRQKKRRSIKPSDPPRSVTRSFSATITLSFETYGAAAQALQSVLLSDGVEFKLSADKAFNHAVRGLLQDDESYEKAKSRIS